MENSNHILDYSTDEDGKPSVSHDDGGEGVSLEEEKSRMVLLLGSLNKAMLETKHAKRMKNMMPFGQKNIWIPQTILLFQILNIRNIGETH